MANCVKNLYICRYGCCSVLILDQGREFVNVVDKRLFTMTKTEHQIYHLQINGLVEWFNQTLQHCLVKVVNNNQTNWDEKLDGALRVCLLTAQQTEIHQNLNF